MATNGHTTERLGEALATVIAQAQDAATAQRLEGIEAALGRIERDIERLHAPGGPMTAAQVAEFLQVHPSTVYGWIRTGELKSRQFGKEYRIKPEWIDEFMEAEERQAREAAQRALGR